MPAFIFLFGYNAKYNPKKIIFRWCIPYFSFQILYITFIKYVLKSNVKYQFTTPYWLLWYVMACIFYQLLIPIFNTSNKRKQILFVVFSFIIALLVGYEDTIGNYMALSRFIVFLPWFLIGYYCKKNAMLESFSVRNVRNNIVVIISMAIIAFSIPFIFQTNLNNRLLYGSFSYSNCDGSLLLRALLYLISFAWIVFLFVGVKPFINKKLIVLTSIGQNTLPIFLLHGFLVRGIEIYYPILISTPWMVLLLSVAIIILFGNKLVNKLIFYLDFSWLEKLSIFNTKE